MSTLTSASTDTEVEAAYDSNASYLEDRSSSKCGAFITACIFLLRRRAVSYTIAGKSVTRQEIMSAMADAKQYFQTRSGGRSRILRADIIEPQGVD